MKPPFKLKKRVVAGQKTATTAVVPLRTGVYDVLFGNGYRLETVTLTEQAQAENDEVLAIEASLPATIARDADEPLYIDALAAVNDRLARLESDREKVKGPFLQACKLIDACAKEARVMLETAKRRITGELGRWEGVRRRAAREEQRRLEQLATQKYLQAQKAISEKRKEEFAREGAAAQQAAAEAVKPTEGLSIRLGWRAEIVDAAEAFARNPQVLHVTVRQSAVNDIVRSFEERREAVGPDSIPGLKLFPITSVGTRSR